MISKEEIETLNKYIELINKDYCSDCNELNCIDNFPHQKISHAIKNTLEYIQQLENKQQKVIEKLEHDNEVDNIAVKKLEEKRRTATSEYYKKSYQTQIHKLNAKIETRKEILKIMKGEE